MFSLVVFVVQLSQYCMKSLWFYYFKITLHKSFHNSSSHIYILRQFLNMRVFTPSINRVENIGHIISFDVIISLQSPAIPIKAFLSVTI